MGHPNGQSTGSKDSLPFLLPIVQNNTLVVGVQGATMSKMQEALGNLSFATGSRKNGSVQQLNAEPQRRQLPACRSSTGRQHSTFSVLFVQDSDLDLPSMSSFSQKHRSKKQ